MTSAAEPEWLQVLRAEAARLGQPRAAEAIGLSTTVVHQVLKGSYKGRVDRVAERVRGALLKATVVCPALGEISRRQCQDEQDRPFATTNPQRVAVWKACRAGCPLSKHKAV